MKLYLDLDGTIIHQGFGKVKFINKQIDEIKKAIKGKKLDGITVISYSVQDKFDEVWFNNQIRPTIEKEFKCKADAVVLNEFFETTKIKRVEGKKLFFVTKAILDGKKEAMVFDDSFDKKETIETENTTIKLFPIGPRYGLKK